MKNENDILKPAKNNLKNLHELGSMGRVIKNGGRVFQGDTFL